MEGLDVSDLADEALTWCSLNGLVVGDAQGQSSGSHPGLGLVHAPVTLIPSPFPADAFFKAYALAPHLNDLVDAVSRDRDFVVSTLSRAAATDSFTASLLELYETTRDDEDLTGVRLGMHRSDYMLHSGGSWERGGGPTLLQVELNTIASSFPGLSARVSDLHRHLQSRGCYGAIADLASGEWRLPRNPAAEVMAEALATAWRARGSPPPAVVLMVVQPGERNQYDQRWLMQELWDKHRVKGIRRTLREVAEQGELRGPGRDLWIGNQQVTVVYYRAGYTPDDYPSDEEWQARLRMERSSAVSCPSLAYHLTGAKKVQQKLAEPGVLERFVSDSRTAGEIRSCFAGLWGLDPTQGGQAGSSNGSATGSAPPHKESSGSKGQRSPELLEALPEAVRDALVNPDAYVLKPQREGGGNNIYGQDVRTKIEEMLSSDNAEESLAAFILMQRIWPPVKQTLMMRRGETNWVDSLSELGIYSVYVRSGSTVLLNKAAGHLLRTKTATSDEGGVATGYAVLDSPYLI